MLPELPEPPAARACSAAPGRVLPGVDARTGHRPDRGAALLAFLDVAYDLCVLPAVPSIARASISLESRAENEHSLFPARPELGLFCQFAPRCLPRSADRLASMVPSRVRLFPQPHACQSASPAIGRASCTAEDELPDEQK